MFYFAYGSNMSSLRLKARTPSARVVGVGRLKDHQLKFHKLSKDGSGKCDIDETKLTSANVLGVVYAIDAAEKPILDGFEGLGNGYKEKQVLVEDLKGQTVQAFSYYATHIEANLKPFSWYKEHVLQGAREHRLPKEYIQAIESIESIPDVDLAREEKELAIYHNS